MVVRFPFVRLTWRRKEERRSYRQGRNEKREHKLLCDDHAVISERTTRTRPGIGRRRRVASCPSERRAIPSR